MSPDGPSERARVRRLHERGHYDAETIFGILDSAIVCHIGYVLEGQPYVTPTAYWRDGNQIYWHGSSASRMLRAQAETIPVCLTVSHLDGLVLARSGYNHSVNYRSVMVFGRARMVENGQEKIRALECLIERLYPGRWGGLRAATPSEVKATTVLAMEIEEGSAKIRKGPPIDDASDYDHPTWAGTIELRTVVDSIVADPRLVPHLAPPAFLSDYRIGGGIDAILIGLSRQKAEYRSN